MKEDDRNVTTSACIHHTITYLFGLKYGMVKKRHDDWGIMTEAV